MGDTRARVLEGGIGEGGEGGGVVTTYFSDSKFLPERLTCVRSHNDFSKGYLTRARRRVRSLEVPAFFAPLPPPPPPPPGPRPRPSSQDHRGVTQISRRRVSL